MFTAAAVVAAASSAPTALIVIVAVIVGLVLLAVALARSMYKVAEPNEAMIVSGFGAHRVTDAEAEETQKGFKIIVGKGVFVLPVFQRVRRLSLDIHEAELEIECVTNQGIKVHVKAVVVYKIADDFASIANAARRFLDKEDQMDAKVNKVFDGHLRSIIGTMTVEEIIRDRDKLTSSTRESSAREMQTLGLTIDSLQIQEIDDEGDYINNLGKPEAARVAAEARMASAKADRDAAQQEAEAAAAIAAAQSTSQIKQAQVQAEADTAKAEAAQAGPLAEATARQKVITQETAAAKLEAEKVEQDLQAQVRRPADADAYKTVTLANAKRDATIAEAEGSKRQTELSADATAYEREKTSTAEAEAQRRIGEAEGAATKAKLVAEADGIKARAEALAENQEAVIAQQVAEKLPEVVAAVAGAFGQIKDLTVLNGAEGVGQVFQQILGTSLGALPLLRKALSEVHGAQGESEHAADSHTASGHKTRPAIPAGEEAEVK